MTMIDCCISLKIIKKFLVVLGVVDMRQLLLIIYQSLPLLLSDIFIQIHYVSVTALYFYGLFSAHILTDIVFERT